MPPSKSKADAKASGPPKSTPATAAKGKPGASPFVGRELFLAFAPGNDALPNEVEVRCVAQADGFLHVVTPQGKASWVNLDHIASIIVVDDESAVSDDPADPSAVTAADLPNMKSAFGEVSVVYGKDLPRGEEVG